MSNILKRIFEKGDFALGTLVGIPSPYLIQVTGAAGFDFVIIDAEHGSLGIESIESMLIAAENAGIVPIIRVAASEQATIVKSLDAGARGIQIPLINNKTEGMKAIQCSKFPPSGRRGLLLSSRAAKFGKIHPEQYIKNGNDEVLIIFQIETAEGVQNLESILALQEVDMIFIGPVDLSQALGEPGNLNSKAVLETMEVVFSQSKAAGKFTGTYVTNPKDARKWIERGVDYLCTGASSIFLKACEEFTRGVRKYGS